MSGPNTLIPKQPTKLFEVLAAEATVVAQATALMAETQNKFAKPDSFFRGETSTVTMLSDEAQARIIEAQESTVRPPTTSVIETLEYALASWANAEDVRATKNVTNTTALADIVLADDTVVAMNVPVDELMGLEARLEVLKKVLLHAPSLDASKPWAPADNWSVQGLMVSPTVTRSKSAKESYVLTLAPATEKHPANVVEKQRDIIVGKTEATTYSTALTTHQKANMLTKVDQLIVAVRQARNRANAVPIIDSKVGTLVVSAIMESLKSV